MSAITTTTTTGTGIPSARCLKHFAIFGAFWRRFNASLLVFVISTFLIPSLIVLLFALLYSDMFGNRLSRLPSTNHGNPDPSIVPTAQRHGQTPRPVLHPSNNNQSTPPRKPTRRLSLKWVVCTILLASAASLSAFQILLVLFARYCLGLHKSDLAYMCFDAAVGATIVLVGALPWLVTTLRLIVASISRWRTARRRGGKSGERDGNGAGSPRGEERGQGLGGGQAVPRPANALPVYIV